MFWLHAYPSGGSDVGSATGGCAAVGATTAGGTDDGGADAADASLAPAAAGAGYKEVMISSPDFHLSCCPGDRLYLNLYLSAGCETDSCVTLEVLSVDAAGRVECTTHAGGAVCLDDVITMFHVSAAAAAADGAEAAEATGNGVDTSAARAASAKGARSVLSETDRAVLQAFSSRKLEARPPTSRAVSCPGSAWPRPSLC